MKKNILTSLCLTAFFAVSIIAITSLIESGTTSVYANTGGSPGGRSGSPNDNATAPFGPGNCTACHSGSTVNSGNGLATITSNIPAGGYVPGQTYTITAGIGELGISKFGFEVTAEKDADNTKTGTFALTNATNTKFVNSNNAVSHTAAGTTPLTTNATTWSFDWTAPVAGTGNVTFYGAFNSADGTGSVGDKIYTKTLAVTEDVSTGLADNLNQTSFSIFPNPAKNRITFKSENDIESVVVYDVNGKMMNLNNDFENGLNIEALSSGIYIVHVNANNTISTQKLIVQ